MKVSLQFWLGLVLSGSALACSSPPPPPPDPPEVEPEPEPPPPPPPKCEALRDQCKANSDTRARIPGTHYVFTPPAGWVYAHLEEATVVQVGDSGPVLVLTTFEPEVIDKQRVALVKSFAELVLIEPPRRLLFYRHDTPGRDDYDEKEVAGLEMTLWDRRGAKRGEDVGPLLILTAPIEDRELFGVAFAPEGDAEGTDAILGAIHSLEPGEKADDDSGDGSSSDEGESK